MEKVTKSLVVRAKEFFGLKDGQSLRDFSAEVRELSDEDRAELVRLFNESGMPTVLSKLV